MTLGDFIEPPEPQCFHLGCGIVVPAVGFPVSHGEAGSRGNARKTQTSLPVDVWSFGVGASLLTTCTVFIEQEHMARAQRPEWGRTGHRGAASTVLGPSLTLGGSSAQSCGRWEWKHLLSGGWSLARKVLEPGAMPMPAAADRVFKGIPGEL